MNTVEVARALRSFAKNNRVRFVGYVRRESQLFELGAMLLAVTHYERAGYDVEPLNATGGEFAVSLSSRGRPWNFSYWRVGRHGQHFFIYTNLAVASAYGSDDGVYVVDVAVTRRAVPKPSRGRSWTALPNRDLITFAEAKRIVVYPMLLAQFVGIVHEIKPRFLGGARPRGFVQADHFDPALVSIGYLHGRSRPIVAGYQARRFKIRIVSHADVSIAQTSRDPQAPSPLA